MTTTFFQVVDEAEQRLIAVTMSRALAGQRAARWMLREHRDAVIYECETPGDVELWELCAASLDEFPATANERGEVWIIASHGDEAAAEPVPLPDRRVLH